MRTTADLFAAFLKCPTKCWLRATGEAPSGNTYAEWVQTQNESFRAKETERLLAETSPGEHARSPSPENLKAAKWRLAVNVVAQASSPAGSGSVSLPGLTPAGTPGQPADGTSALPPDSAICKRQSPIETRLHALERVPSEGRGKAAQFIPIRFVFFNKLGKDDFSLLAGMSEKERRKLRCKGIFTVTQLSYTFRPRRRPKRLRDKREKYHHALKALAIREKKIHIVGSPELKIEGTPVYSQHPPADRLLSRRGFTRFASIGVHARFLT